MGADGGMGKDGVGGEGIGKVRCLSYGGKHLLRQPLSNGREQQRSGRPCLAPIRHGVPLDP